MWFGAFVSILCCPVQAEGLSADSAVLQGVGLDGRWAQDCSKPAGEHNAYVVYVAPENATPTEQTYVDPGDIKTSALSHVRALKNGDIEWAQTSEEVTTAVVTQVRGNRLRTWSSTNSEGLSDIVRGKYSNGRQTLWFNKCDTN